MTQPRLSPDLEAAAAAIFTRLNAASAILIPTHINADGDSLATVIALGRALLSLGKQVVTVISDGRVPPALEFLLTDDAPLRYTGQPLPPTDLTLMVDITGLARLGALSTDQPERFRQSVVLNIDHHISNERFGVVNLVDATAAATAELIYLLLTQWALPITPAIASPLLTGLLTDTLGLQTSSTTPRTLRVAADLVAAGAPLEAIVWSSFRAKPLSSARLFGAIVATATLQDGLLTAEVSQATLAATGAQSGETESAVTYLTGVEGTIVFALYYEQPTGWRVSLRSNSDRLDVSALAGRFGGGGHARAAGVTLQGGPELRARFERTLIEAIAASRRGG